jgi:hypothetical protein
MVVPAAKHPKYSRQHPQSREIRPELPDRRPYHRPKENDLAAALIAGHPAEPAQLAETDPMMRVTGDALRIRPTVNGEENDTPTTLADCVRDGERQASAAADDRKRTIVCRRGVGYPAHSSSPTSALRTAIVSGREPERMNSSTLATSQ